MEETFSKEDINFISKRGNSLDLILKQLEYVRKGITHINLVRSATVGDGIWEFHEQEKVDFIEYFEKHYLKYNISKFVPASGAASRMFKFLLEFIKDYIPEEESINSFINYHDAKELSVFLVGLKSFPFYENLLQDARKFFSNFDELNKDKRDYLLIRTLLDVDKWNFANKPKAILPFHLKNQEVLTPIDEQVAELNYYLPNQKVKKLHFTINEEFQKDMNLIASKYNDCEITYSYQLARTDTLALDLNGNVIRSENNELFFRPGGHGALIENLNQIDTDVVFVKNIDNVAINNKNEIAQNKKFLGGILLKLQFTIFKFLKELQETSVNEQKIHEIVDFINSKLQIELQEDFEFFPNEYKVKKLIKLLNRPIRVCGMVKNEGEPGGGPFWILNHKDHITLQIVESSQVDFSNEKQAEIFKKATHFNPVDMVCGIKDYQGNAFDLNQFVDHEAGFVVEKTKSGHKILAYELPGLWNGAMAFWTTLFVEVPVSTFNPVKTVNDLLKPAHQQES